MQLSVLLNVSNNNNYHVVFSKWKSRFDWSHWLGTLAGSVECFQYGLGFNESEIATIMAFVLSTSVRWGKLWTGGTPFSLVCLKTVLESTFREMSRNVIRTFCFVSFRTHTTFFKQSTFEKILKRSLGNSALFHSRHRRKKTYLSGLRVMCATRVTFKKHFLEVLVETFSERSPDQFVLLFSRLTWHGFEQSINHSS